MILAAEHIVDAVRNAGVIGAGGGGFPTYVKLQAKVDMIIANGSECEPLLTSDRAMMVAKPELLIEGMKYAMQATGASQGVIGIKEHYHDAVDALQKVLPKDGSIKLHLLENYYPAGDEFLLVYEVTGKVIPEGGIPLNVGVVVNNVITLMQIAEAVMGKPVVERTVTLAGEFNAPRIVTVPVGTTYNDLVKLAGGFKRAADELVLVDGGPMMGKLVEVWDAGIGKTTSGVLALPRDHFIVQMMQKTVPQMIKQSKSACCQCFRCSDLCPRNLIGHNLYPHMTMRSIDYNMDEPAANVTSAFLCSQCGVCELIACDFMLLSPRKILGAYRKELVKRGIKNPHHNESKDATEAFADRKISIPMLLKKLDLMQYDLKLPYMGTKLSGIDSIKLVRIPLCWHAGQPAIPVVRVGHKVRRCDIIAATEEGKLGSVYHASINGKVTDVNAEYVEISQL
jgi:Na+-translocating ferredoxin:NAD+ oxidoreductase RnfC subunit